MAQREILDFLKSKPNEVFSTKTLSHSMKLNPRIVTKDVTQLGKYNLIDIQKDYGRYQKLTFSYNSKK